MFWTLHGFLSYQSGIEMGERWQRETDNNSFYRTKVELKYAKRIHFCFERWFLSYQSGIEIRQTGFKHYDTGSFYRTKVELKFNIAGDDLDETMFLSYQSGIEMSLKGWTGQWNEVFIVPKWNWNVHKWNWNHIPEFEAPTHGVFRINRQINPDFKNKQAS